MAINGEVTLWKGGILSSICGQSAQIAKDLQLSAIILEMTATDFWRICDLLRKSRATFSYHQQHYQIALVSATDFCGIHEISMERNL